MRYVLSFLNGVVSLIVGLALLTGGAYAGYALWDNHQIYTAASGVQLEMLRLKPQTAEAANGEAGEEGPSFAELLAVNPDVCGWVSIDNTHIDQPILRGENNFVYINTNVYGEFALSGSIFMDARCKGDFSEGYTLLYGHHMANHGMFGDLDYFKTNGFFELNHTGDLMLPGQTHALHIVASVITDAADDLIFDPTVWCEDLDGLADYLDDTALIICKEGMAQFRARLKAGTARILALSTCSDEFTNARTILLTLLDERPEKMIA